MRRILFALMLLPTLVLSAQSLDRCKELAREHYPLVQKYGLIEQSRDYTVANASKAWLPQVMLSGQATYQSDVMRWPEEFESMLAMQGLDMPGLRKDQYKVQVDVQQTLWDGGKSRAERVMADGEAQQARMSVEVELYAVDKRVEELYFGTLLLQEQQRQLEDMTHRLQGSLNYMNTLVENGVTMQADADAVEVQLLSTGQRLLQVKAQMSSFRRMLQLFIGEPLSDDMLSLPEVEAPIGQESARPELALFDAQMRVLQAKEGLIDVSLMPRVSLFAQGYYGYPGLNMFENMMSSRWSLNGIAGIRLQWNIGGLYTSRTSRLQLHNAMEGIDLQRDIFTFNNRLMAEKETAEIARLRTTLTDDDRIVMLRTRVREAAEVRLREGVIDTNDLLGKITDESAAKIAHSTHEIELMRAIYELKYTLNR